MPPLSASLPCLPPTCTADLPRADVTPGPYTPPDAAPPDAAPPDAAAARAQELAAIRAQIARLNARAAELSAPPDPAPLLRPRPGWPFRPLPAPH